MLIECWTRLPTLAAQGPAGRQGAPALLLRRTEIWAVAHLGQVAVILSGDTNTGTVLDGVSFADPLDPEYDLAALG